MKRNIILTFILIGLVGLEYGCRKDPAPTHPICDKTQYMSAVGLKDIFVQKELTNMNEELNENEAVPYDSFEIRIQVDAKYITQLTKLNYGAYAIMAPSFPLCWPLDSIQIQGVNNSGSINLSPLFNVRASYAIDNSVPITNDKTFKDRVPEFTQSAPLYLRFRMHKAPSLQRLQSIRFTFYNSDGTVFQTSTIPFIITP